MRKIHYGFIIFTILALIGTRQNQIDGQFGMDSLGIFGVIGIVWGIVIYRERKDKSKNPQLES